jgi:hypothetical protein
VSAAYLPSAAGIAELTILLIRRYAEEKRKEVTRFRSARSSLRRMAIRTTLRDSLVEDDWDDVLLLRHGWIATATGDEFIRSSTAAPRRKSSLGCCAMRRDTPAPAGRGRQSVVL